MYNVHARHKIQLCSILTTIKIVQIAHYLDSYRVEGEGQWRVGVSWSRGGACSRDHGLGLVS